MLLLGVISQSFAGFMQWRILAGTLRTSILLLLIYIILYFESPGLKITDETLEDRLAYDEIFVDYFNAFLALPVRTLKQSVFVLLDLYTCV